MKISVDAMGGDYAPEDIVRGAVEGAREYGVGVCLVGPSDKVEPELAKHDSSNLDIDLVHTEEYLVEGEAPAYALRKKRNASVLVATKLVREGKADAVISAGPTGGVIAAALSVLGTLEGISRPVIGGAFLGFNPNTIIMDLGGNVDCQPYQFLDFAVVGTVYARKLLNIDNPSVALLSIGAEEGKGNELVKQSYPLFQQCGLNFIGNVEGYDIPTGKANVIICDGFVGNVLAKYTEALGSTVCQWLEPRIKDKMLEGEVTEVIEELRRNTNAADAAGGGPLWAVDGVACVAHGRSRHTEISKAVEQAKLAVERDLVGALKEELASARDKIQRAED
ncbi:MAG: phosphate acyltransferase PlsX [Chloroflexota bacterium]